MYGCRYSPRYWDKIVLCLESTQLKMGCAYILGVGIYIYIYYIYIIKGVNREI